MVRNKKRTQTGITTGASAAAAAKAAVLLLFSNQTVNQVTIHNRTGQPITVPITALTSIPGGARAVVIKDGGDDPDVTHGLPIEVEILTCPSETVSIQGGRGVGTVTRPGLQVPVGEAAINPVPRQMILEAIVEVLPPGSGVIATINVPGGEQVAARTLNPRLGIIGGISILGTTGIVKPMSEEAFKDSLVPLVDMALALGHRRLALCPGNIGVRFAVERFSITREAVIETSNFIGFMLEACADRGVEEVLLLGHHGKLIKVAAGIFHTHNRVADARMETLAAHAAMAGATAPVVSAIMACRTAEEALTTLRQQNLTHIYNTIAASASTKAANYTGGRVKAGTVLLSYDGSILGLDQNARAIGGVLGWKL